MIDAYKRAFENGITTQPSLADARLLDYLTRAELAKMLSIFTLKYTDRQPILDKPFCDTYTDADQVNAELSSYMTTACKLEIMGLHSDGKTPLDAFMPNKHVSRAELVTVLSRVLYGNTYDNNTADQRWQGHMDKLHTDAVIKDPTPTIQEIRAYVLLMMYRIKAK